MGLHVRLANFFLIFKCVAHIATVRLLLPCWLPLLLEDQVTQTWGSLLPPILPEDQVDFDFWSRNWSFRERLSVWPTLQQSVCYCLAGCLCFWKTKLLKLGGHSFRRFFRKTKLILIFGVGTGPFESDLN